MTGMQVSGKNIVDKIGKSWTNRRKSSGGTTEDSSDGFVAKLPGRSSQASRNSRHSDTQSEKSPSRLISDNNSERASSVPLETIRLKRLPSAQLLDHFDNRIRDAMKEVSTKKQELAESQAILSELKTKRKQVYNGECIEEEEEKIGTEKQIATSSAPCASYCMNDDEDDASMDPEAYEEMYVANGSVQITTMATIGTHETGPVGELEPEFSDLMMENDLDVIGIAKCKLCGLRMPLCVEAIEAHTEKCERDHGINQESPNDSLNNAGTPWPKMFRKWSPKNPTRDCGESLPTSSQSTSSNCSPVADEERKQRRNTKNGPGQRICQFFKPRPSVHRE